MPIHWKEKDKKYKQAQKERGFIQIHPWIPKAHKKEFEDRAEQLRYQHLKNTKD